MSHDDTTPPSLVERDLSVLWHPATHFRDLDRLPPLPIASARGVWLRTTDGREILDAISSWWTCLHGHGHPRLVEAVRTQIERLDHVMLAGFTHESAVGLAEALLALAPGDPGKVFYADCGSAAIEVALKMSFQARRQRGEHGRTRFATLRGGYHGETLGALGVGGSDAYRALFAPLLVEPLYLTAPALPHHAHADLGTDAGARTPEADAAVALLETHAHEITALIVEPLVQCAGRMTMTGAGFYRRIAHTAQRLGIHVIADEIAVAFGRTGRLFASSWAGVEPDLLCLSKGLSGGVLPLACVLVRRGFEDDFKGDPSRSFLHSHTFTGNPIACAAGLASLRLLTEGGTLNALPRRIEAVRERLERVAQACPAVTEHRQTGMIAALHVAPRPGKTGPEGGRLGLALREAALARGVLLRPLHDIVYWMPPLVIEDHELDRLADVTIETIEAVLG
jgi:adenosylmethionine---8-amino-7-oxononanoate aminotransferase